MAYGVATVYYNVFNWLENNNILNVDNPKHLATLQKVFLPRIRRSLESFKNAWNYHPISSECNYTPRQLMLMHLPPQELDIHISQVILIKLLFGFMQIMLRNI